MRLAFGPLLLALATCILDREDGEDEDEDDVSAPDVQLPAGPITLGTLRAQLSAHVAREPAQKREVRYDVPVVFCEKPENAGRLIERWVFWFAREMVETVNSLWREREAAAHRPPQKAP
jgi:hypothetical protein